MFFSLSFSQISYSNNRFRQGVLHSNELVLRNFCKYRYKSMGVDHGGTGDTFPQNME